MGCDVADCAVLSLSTLFLIATYNLESYTSITPLPFENEMVKISGVREELPALGIKMDHPIILFFFSGKFGLEQERKTMEKLVYTIFWRFELNVVVSSSSS